MKHRLRHCGWPACLWAIALTASGHPTVLFDLDTASPALPLRGALSPTHPLLQVQGGLGMALVAPTGTVSVQTSATFQSAGLPPPPSTTGMSGKFLYAGGATNVLELRFDEPVSRVVVQFATPDIQATREVPTSVTLQALSYEGPTRSEARSTTNGAYVDAIFAAGTLEFDPGFPFAAAQILIQSGQPEGTPYFLVDSIQATPSEDPRRWITGVASPGHAGTVTGSDAVEPGTQVVLHAEATPGFAFESWSEDGVLLGTNAVLLIESTSNRWITANFAPTHAIHLSALPTVGGRVDGGGTYLGGSLATIVATPAAGYSFSGWMEKGKVVSRSATYSWTVSGGRVLTAGFLFGSPDEAIADPIYAGTITGTGIHAPGTPVTLTAQATSGYAFVRWTEGGVEVSTNAILAYPAAGPRSWVAHFVAAPRYSITTRVNPILAGTAVGDGTFGPTETVTVSAVPSKGYVFQGWTALIGLTPTVVSTAPVFSFQPTASRTLTANFVAGTPETIVVGVTANASGGLLSGGGSYVPGAPVTLQAIETEGWRFLGWMEGGRVIARESTLRFTAASNRTLLARFSPLLQITRETTGKLHLFWPGGARGFVLESTSPTSESIWTPLPLVPAASPSGLEVLVDAGEPSTLYRLHQP